MNAATRVAAASLLAVTLTACGSSDPPSSPARGTSEGTPGVSFVVNVSRQPGGTVTSDDGQIRCGTGGSACTGSYGWSAQAILTATPDPGFAFGTWAGDCQYTGPCVLDTRGSGADKFVLAVFGLPGEVQHGNFSSPAVHGPAFLDRLGALPGSFDCASSSCHGSTYDGLGIAPSCNACHAAAGWSEWRTNCTFCHGTRVKSGYVFASDPARAAPPDAIGQRLTGVPAPERSGAHAQHLTGRTAAGDAWAAPFPCATCHPVPTDLSHVGGSAARATVLLSGAGTSLPESLGTYDPAAGTCSAYCHGNGRVPGASPAFASSGIACDGCHGVPPGAGHPYSGSDLTACAGCHPETMGADGTLLAAGGRHVDGVVQASGACDSCHGFAPPTGAHLAHFGLAGAGTSGYGDTRTLEDRFPGETPTTAPGVYAFGCGSCHPLDLASHRNGLVDVELYAPAAPAGSLKSRAAPAAAYDGTTGTCANVYCHSSGQEWPSFRTTPGWASGARLACDDCHDNPPRYASGGPGSATANGHLAVDSWAWVVGHFGGVGGFGHADRHGGSGETAITCQTCHFDTTDPSSTGVSGFFWLDTTGDYAFPGTDPAQGPVDCARCHDGTGDASPGTGAVLPLRHVNGTRDVAFDPRTAIDPTIPYLPAPPNTPTMPYYRTNDTSVNWRNAVVTGTTASFSLAGAAYDPATKTCTVACHNLAPGSGLQTVWGTAFDWNCSYCHPY